MTQKSKMGLNWSCSMNMPRAFIMNKCALYYQKVVILPLFVTTIFPYHFILPCFSLANLVQPTRPSSIALLLTGYFLSSLPPIKDWGIPMK